MSIQSNPYPMDGVFGINSKYEAERIIEAAVINDGYATIGDDLKSMLEPGIGNHSYWVKSGIKLDRVRIKVVDLWEAMSKKAKMAFLRRQLAAGERYVADCQRLVKQYEREA